MSYQVMKRYVGNLVHTAEWQEPIWKGYTLDGSTYMTFLKKQNYRASKKDHGSQD
jgi:hypothetical protein